MHIAKKLKIIAVPLFKDNYSYIVLGCSKNSAILIDPAAPSVVMNFLTKYLPQYQIKHVLYTHKHWDHAGGSQELINLVNDQELTVVSGEEDSKHIPGVNLPVGKDTSISLHNFKVEVIQVPCHTRGHVLYYFDANKSQTYPVQIDCNKKHTEESKEVTVFQSNKCVFVGDTLFIGGTGMFFEGTAEEMSSNYQKFVALDDDTEIFCGHEYTKSNIEWSSKVDYENKDLLSYKEQIGDKLVTIPSSIGLEKKINIFLRSLHPSESMRKLSSNPVHLLKILREMKSNKKTLIE